MRSILIALMLMLAGGATAATKVTLALNWFPEMEHGGFYAALEEGYYAAEGLDVKIMPGGPDVQPVPLVATQNVQFAVANADQVIFGRAQGANVRALLAPMQVSPRCIMVHADSGIAGFGDINGMTVAMGTQDAFAQFLLKKYPFKDVKIVPYPGNISVFLGDKKFAQQAYNISEPFLAMKNGGNPKVLMVADAGHNPYTSLLIVSDAYLAANREVCARMARATLRGWGQYMKDPAKAHAAITKLNPEMGAEILAFGHKEMQPMVYDAEAKARGLGTMNEKRWSDLLAQMEELKLVPAGKVKAAECFTADFLALAKE